MSSKPAVSFAVKDFYKAENSGVIGLFARGLFAF